MQLAIAQTARNPYGHALKGALPTPLEQTLAQGDTLKLGYLSFRPKVESYA